MDTTRFLHARWSIGVALTIITAGLAVGMALFAWAVLDNAHARVDESRRMQLANRLSDEVITAAGAQALERGIITGLLSAQSLASPRELTLIESLQRRGNQAQARAFALAEQLLHSDDGNVQLALALEDARQAFQAHEHARAVAYEAIASGSVDIDTLEWFQVATHDIEAGMKLRIVSILPSADSNSNAFGLAANLHLKQLIWLASEYAGRERALIAAAIGAGRRLDDAQYEASLSHRAIVDASLRAVLQFEEQTKAPTRQAMDELKREFLGQFEHTRARIYSTGLGATSEPVVYHLSRREWITESTRAIDTILALSNAISHDVATRLATTYQVNSKSKTTGAVSLALAIVFGALALMIVWLRVVRRLVILRQSAERLGAGDLDERAELAGSDEIGRLATAFNAMAANVQAALLRVQAMTQAKSEFLASMSHELRTPLNGILGYTQILLADRELAARRREFVETIHRSGEHLLALLNDILDLSKIEAGRMELREDDFHLHTCIDKVMDTFRLQATRKRIDLEFRPMSELPRVVHGDEQRLRQILLNLLSNAIKFTDHGEVTLQVGIHHGRIRFLVEDTGTGIDEEDLEDIFAPFEQVGVNRDHAGGTGLGLAITRRLAAMMGSELRVRSTPGAGSAFWLDIELPAVEGKDVPGTPEDPVIVGYRGPRRRVLIVDDRAAHRDFLSDMLTPLGFEVTQASDGESAMQLAESVKPHVILMDIQMPGMDGLTVTRRIRRLSGLETFIIAVSASAFAANQQQCLEAGCDGCITKPVRLAGLLALLQRFLDLQWQFAGATGNRARSEGVLENMAAPPPEVLAQLYEMARKGDIRALRTEATRLATPEYDYPTFARHLGTLGKTFQMKRIRAFLESFMSD